MRIYINFVCVFYSVGVCWIELYSFSTTKMKGVENCRQALLIFKVHFYTLFIIKELEEEK